MSIPWKSGLIKLVNPLLIGIILIEVRQFGIDQSIQNIKLADLIIYFKYRLLLPDFLPC